MKIKLKFKNAIILSAVIITFIPLVLSYGIFVFSKLGDINENIRRNLQEVGYSIAKSEFIAEKLYNKENDMSIQEYTKGFIENFKDVDIVVVADMSGEKYSHLDESQIGKKYVGEDKIKVLNEGESYFSTMEGSMGITLRWYQPIFYNNVQVGFVMVGKYNKEIGIVNYKTRLTYFILFIVSLTISIIASKIFANKVKKSILNMEPLEIATLYKEKNIILDSVKDGIISLNKNNKVMEINKGCYELFEDFKVEDIVEKLKVYVDTREDIEMKEVIIKGKKVFVTIKHIILEERCPRVIITLTDRTPINKIAKEITGVDEVVKNLRANIHEFKNSLYVILGLIKINAYEDAEEYILKLQKIQENTTNKFSCVEDNYVRGLLISRELVAREKMIEFLLTEESFLNNKHGIIDSNDIVTILGNLIENAFDACVALEKTDGKVEVTLYEDDNVVEIQVRDNGKAINKNLRAQIFEQGISSNGEGRGTGLYLVKSRVELYNGEIDIEEFGDEKIFVVTMLKEEKK